MAKYSLFKISTGTMVRKWHALFRVELKDPILRKYKRQISYFLVNHWDMPKAVH